MHGSARKVIYFSFRTLFVQPRPENCTTPILIPIHSHSQPFTWEYNLDSNGLRKPCDPATKDAIEAISLKWDQSDASASLQIRKARQNVHQFKAGVSRLLSVPPIVIFTAAGPFT